MKPSLNVIYNNITLSSRSIRFRLILLFVSILSVVFFVSGFFLRWHLRSTLDETLGSHLRSLAAACAVQLDSDLLISIQAGRQASRTHRNILNQIEQFRHSAHLRRIYIFSEKGYSIADTDSMTLVGQAYVHLAMLSHEMKLVFSGRTASSILFEGIDGKLYKTALAPIKKENNVVAIVAVEGSADMLNVVNEVQRYLLYLGSLSMVGSLILASLFARKITQPVKKLAQAADTISRGNLENTVPQLGSAEIKVLSRTMEVMRRSILQRDKQQQAMLASVAHEIRNPLGGIELFAGMLSDDVNDPELNMYARRILREVQNLKAIIQEFLSYAKPAPAKKEACDVETVWNDVVSLAAITSSKMNLKFRKDILPDAIFVDPQHLKQIFLNLLANSIQAMQESGTIFVELLQDSKFCKIRFADTGPGIDKSKLEQIFEPFYTTRKSGVGLGLAIVKNLVVENGGTIHYEENEPHGAVFIMHFPLVE